MDDNIPCSICGLLGCSIHQPWLRTDRRRIKAYEDVNIIDSVNEQIENIKNTDEKPDTMIVLHTATQLDITGYTQDERDSLHEQLRDTKNQKDWLQIYCALIASPGESTIEKAVQDTDTFYGAYQKRWAD